MPTSFPQTASFNGREFSFIYVTAAGSFTVRPRGFSLFRRIRNYGYAHGVHKTLTSCQQNPILFERAGLTTPTRLGFLFQLTFSVTSRCNGDYDSNTKCKGHQYGSDDSSRCRLHHASDAINSITTQKQLYLTRKTVGTSGTVPGEHTVGQTRLMVQLAVRSQRNSIPFSIRTGLFIGVHDVIAAWDDAFYVTMPATSFQTFETMLRASWA